MKTLSILGLIALIFAACVGPEPTPSPTPSPTQPTIAAPTPTAATTLTPTPTRAPTAATTRTPAPLRPPDPIDLRNVHSFDWTYRSREPIPSLEKQILASDVIVLAQFVAAAPAVARVPGRGYQQPTYRPALALTFTATEYLKGTGPNTFSVELWNDGWGMYWDNGEYYSGYLTEARALTEAKVLARQRKTRYDDRPGVLFLDRERPTEGVFRCVLFNTDFQGYFVVDVDSMSRAWLPLQPILSANSGWLPPKPTAFAENPTIVTNRPPPNNHIEPSTDPNTMKLDELRARISALSDQS